MKLMGWRTYLVMYFGSEVGMTEVSEKVESIGFVTTIGPVDFIYDWKGKVPSKKEILALGDRLAEVLRGTGAIFNLDTHD